MDNHNTLFYNVMKFVHRTGVKFHDIRIFMTFAWAVVGLILSKKPHFSHWQLFRRDETKAASKARQYSRWLHNERIRPMEIYRPLVESIFSDWERETIYLALDTSQLWKRFVIIRVSMVYCGRALPIGWLVCASGSATVSMALYRRLLAQIAQLLPSSCKVVLLGDRAFGEIELLKVLKQLGWHFRIRLKHNYWVHDASHCARKVASLMPKNAGCASFINDVWITKRKYGPVHLALAHVITADGSEKWAIVSDEPVDRPILDEYGLRFCIEENFLDDKSGGFNLEDSGLEDSESLSRLCLIIATATLYLVSTGKAIEALESRHLVDTHWFRGLSFLQIGWRYCLRAVIFHKWLLNFLWIPPDPDPEPAIASWKQFHTPMFELRNVAFL